MGCRISLLQSPAPEVLEPSKRIAGGDDTTDHRPAMPDKHSTKARFERLMCLARDTPEPVFELSDCALKSVPSAVFALCKVLRKERLDLSGNRLNVLFDNSQCLTIVGDLQLLTHLDVARNALRTLPDELTQLVNLQDLRLQHNRLVELPPRMGRLHRLEFLDASHNQLQHIRPVSCMPALRVLNVTGNAPLDRLPMELSTCEALVDILCDAHTVRDPPVEVLERGASAILAYLAGNEQGWRDVAPMRRRDAEDRPVDDCVDMVQFEVLDAEEADEAMRFDELAKQVQNEQQRNREQLLLRLVEQQTASDALVSELHEKRDAERNKLIADISNAELSSSEAVDRLLGLRQALLVQSPTDWAAAERDQLALLDRHRSDQSELQRARVLREMSAQLTREHRAINAYAERQTDDRADWLRHLERDSERLQAIVTGSDRQRSVAVDRIVDDEQLQRAAVASLIDQSDGRAWALRQQMRMVEAELVRMTRDELHRQRGQAGDQMNKLSEQRMDLSRLLGELMDAQDGRRKQLLGTLRDLDARQHERQADFWLLQYQKLLDARTDDDQFGGSSLDPELGRQLLAHGVVHLLPFLSGLLRKAGDCGHIDDDALRAAGIRNATERVACLRAIEAFASRSTCAERTPSAPEWESGTMGAKAATEESTEMDEEASDDGRSLSECVVCMERASKIVFLPCGHLCCCPECQETLTVCPMCRSSIERRIKVIQV